MDESVVKHLEQPADAAPWQKVLLKAAELIETRGHMKGDFEGEGGQVCALKALTLAAGLPDWTMYDRIGAAFDRFCKRIGVSGAEHYSQAEGLCHWNNMPERTAEEVVSTMRRVALGG